MKLKKIWKNKFKILEGVWYNHVVFYFNKVHWAKKLVEERRDICKQCPHFDKKGQSDLVMIKGLPACSICGCNIKEKTACLSCDCTLKELHLIPRWIKVSVKNDYLIEQKLDG